jgi:hypothetical protein
MLPTLPGRIQTRIFVTLVIGGIVTLIVSLFLPGVGGLSLGDVYEITFSILVATTVLGIGWEFIYQFLMQFRWEKDWPTFFGLITIVNEGLLIWFLIKADLIPNVPETLALSTFLTQFIAVWIVAWLWVNGPMRVFTVHWRFRGGRLV